MDDCYRYNYCFLVNEMPRPARKLHYDVTTFEGNWWWVDEIKLWSKGSDYLGKKVCSSNRTQIKTFKEAKASAQDLKKLAGSAVILRWWRHRGKRYCLEFETV